MLAFYLIKMFWNLLLWISVNELDIETRFENNLLSINGTIASQRLRLWYAEGNITNHTTTITNKNYLIFLQKLSIVFNFGITPSDSL